MAPAGTAARLSAQPEPAQPRRAPRRAGRVRFGRPRGLHFGP
ncbi:hypothetical protein [Lysobacter gummosus]